MPIDDFAELVDDPVDISLEDTKGLDILLELVCLEFVEALVHCNELVKVAD